MLSRTAWVGLVAVGICLAGLGAAAANPPLGAGFGAHGRFPHHDGPIARLIMGKIGRLMVLKSELGVTDEQRGKLREIGLSHRSEAGPAIAKVSASFRGLRDAVLADDADEASIRTAADAHGKAVGDLAVVLSKMAKEGREVLTEDQRTQIKSFIAQNDAAADKLHQEMKAKFEKK